MDLLSEDEQREFSCNSLKVVQELRRIYESEKEEEKEKLAKREAEIPEAMEQEEEEKRCDTQGGDFDDADVVPTKEEKPGTPYGWLME